MKQFNLCAFPRKLISVMKEGALLNLKVFMEDKSDDMAVVAGFYVIHHPEPLCLPPIRPGEEGISSQWREGPEPHLNNLNDLCTQAATLDFFLSLGNCFEGPDISIVFARACLCVCLCARVCVWQGEVQT